MTLTEWIGVIVAGGLMGFLASMASTAFQAWKWKSGEQSVSAATAANSITGASMTMVKEMRQDIADLRARVTALEDEVARKDKIIEEQERELTAWRRSTPPKGFARS